MNSKLSVAKFIQFIEEQPEDEIIGHHSWAACALGKYLKVNGMMHHFSCDKLTRLLNENDDGIDVIAFIDSLRRERVEVSGGGMYDVLDFYQVLNHGHGDTYGELFTILSTKRLEL